MEQTHTIKLIGVGDFGGKIVEELARYHYQEFDFAVINSHQHWQPSGLVGEWLLIGNQGCRGNPELGRQAAKKHITQIQQLMHSAEILLFVVGLGGGTGTGAIPILTQTAVQMGKQIALFLTFPLSAGSTDRVQIANETLNTLQTYPAKTEVLYIEDWIEAGDEITYHDDLYLDIRENLLTQVERFLVEIQG